MPAGEVWTSILCSYLGVSLVSGITAFLFLKSPCEHKLKRRMHLMSLMWVKRREYVEPIIVVGCGSRVGVF
eukprot:643302-Amorphochlora_amoeboformis.AAC.1